MVNRMMLSEHLKETSNLALLNAEILNRSVLANISKTIGTIYKIINTHQKKSRSKLRAKRLQNIQLRVKKNSNGTSLATLRVLTLVCRRLSQKESRRPSIS